MWSVWDKATNINGFTAEEFLNKNKHLKADEVIYIKTVDGVVTEVQSKAILAKVYGIDETLSDEDFIKEYETKLNGSEETEAAQ